MANHIRWFQKTDALPEQKIVMRSIDYLWVRIDPKFSEGGICCSPQPSPGCQLVSELRTNWPYAYVIPIHTVGNFPDNGRSVFLSYHNIISINITINDLNSSSVTVKSLSSAVSAAILSIPNPYEYYHIDMLW